MGGRFLALDRKDSKKQEDELLKFPRKSKSGSSTPNRFSRMGSRREQPREPQRRPARAGPGRAKKHTVNPQYERRASRDKKMRQRTWRTPESTPVPVTVSKPQGWE